jgi:DNA-binding NarL/FixJ family response regulator
MKDVRILVADDHAVVRSGVRAMLESQPGWTVCGEAKTGREAVAMAIELKPDITILDIAMPELNGLEAARQIRNAGVGPVLIMTVHDVDEVVYDAFAAGASGYVLKTDAGYRLVDAVRAVLGGGKFVSHVDHAALEARSHPHGAPEHRASSLTSREREVLQLLAEGRTNKEVAVALGIATKTAETHRARVMSKLRIHTMADLVRYAIRNRIVEP